MTVEIVRGLQENLLRSALASLGIAIAVVGMVLPSSIVGSIGLSLTSGIRALGSETVFVVPKVMVAADARRRPLSTTDVARIRRSATAIGDIAPLLSVSGMIRACGLNRVTIISGATPDSMLLERRAIESGRSITDSDVREHVQIAVLGAQIAQELDCLRDPGAVILVSGKPFKVVGVLTPSGSRFGTNRDNVVFIPLPFAESRYAQVRPPMLIAAVADGYSVTDAKRQIEQALRATQSPPAFSTESQTELLAASQSLANGVVLSIFAIVSVALVIAGIGVLNAITTAVLERRFEIGLRRAVGATRRRIGVQFVSEAFAISCCGALAGLLIGIIFTVAVERVFSLPIFIDLSVCVVAVSSGIAMGTTAGIWPALRAAFLNPIDAVHHN